MFQIESMTEAHVASVTNRVEKHGDDDKPAVSIALEIEAANTLLDCIDPALRHALYKAVDGQEQLPGVEPTTPVLRCNSFEKHTLTTAHEGWTLAVDDGIDDSVPMVFGGVKVDKLVVDAKQGGSIVLRFRCGTSDVDADKLGKLAMHNGQSIWVTLKAPEKKAEAIDGSVAAFEADHPSGDDSGPAGEGDATDLFSQTSAAGGAGTDASLPACEACGGDMAETENPEGVVYLRCQACGWTPPAVDSEGGTTDSAGAAEPERGENCPFPTGGAASAEGAPQSATVENVPSKRTARGREKTKAALAAGAAS